MRLALLGLLAIVSIAQTPSASLRVEVTSKVGRLRR